MIDCIGYCTSPKAPTFGDWRFAQQLLLRCSTSCIIHMDVVNADIAGANICPCSRGAKPPYGAE